MCVSRCCAVSWRKGSVQAMAEEPQPPAILHEKQRLQLCLLHALNNLYQRETTFTRCELNGIASSLPSELHHGGPFSRLVNPHYNILTGNYDANVLMRALQTRGAEIRFCNPRMGADTIDLDDPRLIGFILNYEIGRLGLWKGRHWVAMRKIQDTWFDLDSDLTGPVPIGNNEQLRQFLSERLEYGTEVIRVLKIAE